MFSAMRYSIFVMVMVCLGLSQGVRGDDTPQWAGDPYPLGTDPVTGELLSQVDKPITMLHDGRELRFVSDANVETFLAAPDGYLPKVDAQIIENQMPYYSMTTCPISGDELGSEMGEPVDFVYRNRLIRFCCKSCISDFKKDSVTAIATIDAAVIAQQKMAYPLENCPVSGKKLDSMEQPYDMVVANRLVRLCCKGCKKKLWANAAVHLATIDTAWNKSGVSFSETPHSEHDKPHKGHDMPKKDHDKPSHDGHQH